MAERSADWRPDERIVRQWARHVEKLRRQVKSVAGEGAALRLVLKAEDVSRFLTVSDGDGFVAAGLRIRLLGVDAPEYEQLCHEADGRTWPCGERARWRLYELLSGKELELHVHDVDCYGRLLCVCHVEGVDVAEVMVREGLAICYRSQRYAAAEKEAAEKGRGMWRGAFEEPESWRISQRGGSGENGRSKEVARQSCRKPRTQRPSSSVSPAGITTQQDTGATPAASGGWEELHKAFSHLLKQLR